MDLIEKLFASAARGLGNLLGLAISAAGEKVGASLPTGRPIDARQTRRRHKGDEKELLRLYKQLERHRPNAMAWATQFCRDCVTQAIDPTPEEWTSPIIQATYTLCQNILTYEGYFPLPQINFER